MSPKSFPNAPRFEICPSVWVMDIWGDQSGLVALVNQSLELPLLPRLHPPSSCATGPAQEQLPLPLPVSTTLHHSPPKPLLVCERACARGAGSLAEMSCRGSRHKSHTVFFFFFSSRKQISQVCMTWVACKESLMGCSHKTIHQKKKKWRNREILSHWCNSDSKHTKRYAIFMHSLKNCIPHAKADLLMTASRLYYNVCSKGICFIYKAESGRQTARGARNSQNDHPRRSDFFLRPVGLSHFW